MLASNFYAHHAALGTCEFAFGLAVLYLLQGRCVRVWREGDIRVTEIRVTPIQWLLGIVALWASLSGVAWFITLPIAVLFDLSPNQAQLVQFVLYFWLLYNAFRWFNGSGGGRRKRRRVRDWLGKRLRIGRVSVEVQR